MITLQSINLQRGTKLLFDDASLTIFAKQKVGLIGLNGSGKSSLIAMILRKLQPDAGEVFIQSNIKIAHLSQEVPTTADSAIDYVVQGDKELITTQQKLALAEAEHDSAKISELHNVLFHIGGYSANARAAKLLNGLGFQDNEHAKAVNQFSGGWRMRLNLAQVLMCRADLLLLDEPTNYLDLDAIIWLEHWLQDYAGTLLLISHDREFLDNVIQKVVHVHNKKLDLYTGNYSDFEDQRAAKLEYERAMYDKQQTKIESITKFVNRFKAKASKAKQAQSRLKTLERMEKVVLTQIESPFSFKFFTAANCGAPLLRFEHADFGYTPNKIQLKDINFSLSPEDRIGILGVNGAGKSTLMKLLSGMLKPTAGNLFANKNLKIGYFAQHQVDQLDINESAIAHLQKIGSAATEQQLRNYLGGFNFKEDMVFNAVATFSGGEKARLVLAMIVWQKPNLLLLDEPTNHLDLDMREALAYALQDYAGALVLVSHDRSLLKATVDDFYLVTDNKVAKFSGDLRDYEKWILDSRKKQLPNDNTSSQTPNKNKTKEKKLQQLETKLAKLYLEKEQCERLLADANIYQKENQTTLQECTKKLATIKSNIELIEAEWDDAAN